MLYENSCEVSVTEYLHVRCSILGQTNATTSARGLAGVGHGFASKVRMLSQVCKAYLSSYIELHPNLQAVLQHYSQSATCYAVAHIGASKHGTFLLLRQFLGVHEGSLNDNSAANSAVGKKVALQHSIATRS